MDCYEMVNLFLCVFNIKSIADFVKQKFNIESMMVVGCKQLDIWGRRKSNIPTVISLQI